MRIRANGIELDYRIDGPSESAAGPDGPSWITLTTGVAALLGLDYGPRLPRLAMPVLFVSGEYDRVGAPPYVMQSMADRIPGARHVVLPRATHISVVCNPQAFVRTLADFVPRD